MENNNVKKNNYGLMIILIIAGFLIGVAGYKLFVERPQDDKQSNTECTCNKCESSNVQEDSLKNANGKIVVKRNGIAKLENVPSDIVGKYQDSFGNYYKLNSDGTAEISSNSGCSTCGSSVINSLSFQISFVNDEHIIVDLYSASNQSIPGGFLIGDKWNGNYRFMLADGTPTTNACDQQNMFVKK